MKRTALLVVLLAGCGAEVSEPMPDAGDVAALCAELEQTQSRPECGACLAGPCCLPSRRSRCTLQSCTWERADWEALAECLVEHCPECT